MRYSLSPALHSEVGIYASRSRPEFVCTVLALRWLLGLWLLGLRLWLRLLGLCSVRRGVLSLGCIGHARHLAHVPARCIRDQNSQTIQSEANDAIQFHSRLLISSH